MNRRQLLKLLLSGVVGSTLDVDQLLWIPNKKKIFLPSPTAISLFGIPYHHSNASIGQWLGFERLGTATLYKEKHNNIIKELQKLVETLTLESKRNKS